jgi:hypothetical protein
MKLSCLFGKHSPDWATLNLRRVTEQEQAALAEVGLAHLTARYEVKCKNCGALFHKFNPNDSGFAAACERLQREASAE